VAIRLFVADSEPVVRLGLAALFAGTDIEIAAVASSAAELAAFDESGNYNLLITESVFPDGSGISAIAQLRERGVLCRILILSSVSYETSFIQAIAAGTDSYLLKTSETGGLLRTIQALGQAAPHPVDEKPWYFAGELARFTQSVKSRTRPAVDYPLTQRQIQILRCVASGLGNKEIASVLKIKVDTVKEHIRNILRLVNAKDRTAAAVWAFRNGLIR